MSSTIPGWISFLETNSFIRYQRAVCLLWFIRTIVFVALLHSVSQTPILTFGFLVADEPHFLLVEPRLDRFTIRVMFWERSLGVNDDIIEIRISGNI